MRKLIIAFFSVWAIVVLGLFAMFGWFIYHVASSIFAAQAAFQ